MRCSLSLCVPRLASREGNALLYSLIVGLLLTGPLTNIIHNIHETSKSASCLADISNDHLDQLSESYKQAHQDIVRQTAQALSSWQEISKAITSVVGPVGDAFETANREMDKVFTGKITIIVLLLLTSYSRIHEK